jgi:hypothetical protein
MPQTDSVYDVAESIIESSFHSYYSASCQASQRNDTSMYPHLLFLKCTIEIEWIECSIIILRCAAFIIIKYECNMNAKGESSRATIAASRRRVAKEKEDRIKL